MQSPLTEQTLSAALEADLPDIVALLTNGALGQSVTTNSQRA